MHVGHSKARTGVSEDIDRSSNQSYRVQNICGYEMEWTSSSKGDPFLESNLGAFFVVVFSDQKTSYCLVSLLKHPQL